MPRQAKVVNVVMVATGSQTADDLLAGTTLIPLDNVSDFADDFPASLVIEDVMYTYVDKDDDNDTLTLSTGLASDIEGGTQVRIYPLSEEKQAMLDLDDGEDVKLATIPYNMQDALDTGIRDPFYQESVWIEEQDDGEAEYTIVDLMGQIPVRDGSYLDPTTVPAYVPAAPEVSPAIRVVATPQDLVVITENVAPGTDLDYFISMTDFTGSTPPAGSLLMTTSSTILQVRTLADGTSALAMGFTYYLAVQAHNASGSAPMSDVVAANLSPLDSTHIAELSVSKLVSGDMIAAMAIVGALTIGSNITFDPDNGLRIDTPNGLTQFAADGTSSTVAGNLIASALTVMGQLAIRGTTNEISKSAQLTLAGGTTAPASAPTVTSDWGYKKGPGGFNRRGMAYYGSNIYVTETVYGAYVTKLLEDTSSTFVGGYPNMFNALSSRSELKGAWGGIQFIGTRAYVLCQSNEAISGSYFTAWYVYVMQDDGSGNFTYVSRWKFEPSGTFGGNSQFDPAIGIKGSNLVFAQCGKSGNLQIWEYTVAGVMVGSPVGPTNAGASWAMSKNCRGIVYNAADFGTAKYVLIFQDYATAFVIDGTSKARDTGNEWKLPNADIRGIVWDATLGIFRCMDDTKLYDFSKFTTMSTGPLWVATTWRRSNATAPMYAAYETQLSPYTQVLNPVRRARYVVTTTDIPDLGGTSDADSVTVFAGRGTTKPAASAMWRQSSPSATSRVLLNSIAASGANAGSLGPAFPNVSPGILQSTGSDGLGRLVKFAGDGSWRLGHLAGNADGTDANDQGWIDFVPGAATNGAAFNTTAFTTARYRVKSGWVQVHLTRAATTAVDETGSPNYGNLDATSPGAIPPEIRPGITSEGTGRWDDVPISPALTTGGTIVITGGGIRNYIVGSVLIVQFHYPLG